MDKYLFFKKIKPGAYLWCVSMQARVKFEAEAWIGVNSAHTTWCSTYRILYGNIFINTEAFGLSLTSKDIEFEVYEDANTEGKEYNTFKSIPSKCNMPFYLDIPYEKH